MEIRGMREDEKKYKIVGRVSDKQLRTEGEKDKTRG